MNLVVTSKADPLNIAFIAITLYFLRTFLCASNAEDINSEGGMTMIWSAYNNRAVGTYIWYC